MHLLNITRNYMQISFIVIEMKRRILQNVYVGKMWKYPITGTITVEFSSGFMYFWAGLLSNLA